MMDIIETNKRDTLVIIPYWAGLSERVKKKKKKKKKKPLTPMVYLLSACLKPVNKLCSRFVHIKDKAHRDKQSNLVYGFKCKGPNCSEAYVARETKQSVLGAPRSTKQTLQSLNTQNIWTSNWYGGCYNPRSGRTVVRVRSLRSHFGVSGKAILEQVQGPQISVIICRTLGTNHWSIFLVN